MSTGVAVYLRISDDRAGLALGVDRQRKDCLALCERRGWPIADTYTDNDISAWSGKKPRPEYERMLADIRSGTVGGVVVYDLDRLTRQPRELEAFIDTCAAAGADRLGTASGEIDLSKGNDRMVARMLGAVAVKSSEDQSRRIRRKAEELSEAGKSVGGARPFGFEPDQATIREGEAAEVRRAVEAVLTGASIGAICRDLNGRGVVTVRGGQWTPAALRYVLRSPRYAGLQTFRGQVVGKATWAPIVTADQHRQVRALLSGRTNVRRPRSYLLTGAIFCTCGGPMVASPTSVKGGRKLRRYGCLAAGHGHAFILADHVEPLIAEAIFHYLDGPAFAAASRDAGENTTADTMAQLARDERKLEALAEAFGRDKLTLEEWNAARGPIRERIAAAQNRLEATRDHGALRALRADPAPLRAVWAAMELGERIAIVRTVLKRVTVAPVGKAAGAFKPERVSVEWAT
jgi:site-specific DNA recombinase